MNPIVIVGSGGFAQELVWIIEEINARQQTWQLLVYLDPLNPGRKDQSRYDVPILGGREAVNHLPSRTFFCCGIGEPNARRSESHWAEQAGLLPVSLVHPSVITARHVEVGNGTVIGAGTIIGPYARIGRHCAINLAVTVGHNSTVSDYCVLSPGARISGHATLDEGVF